MAVGAETVQRRAVLEVLQAAGDHPTANEIHTRVRTVVSGIGAATVYRTLRALVDAGMARELRLNSETVVRYDANVDRHDHLVCDTCSSVVDVTPQVPIRTPASLAGTSGFEITGHELRLVGRCADCRAATSQDIA